MIPVRVVPSSSMPMSAEPLRAIPDARLVWTCTRVVLFLILVGKGGWEFSNAVMISLEHLLGDKSLVIREKGFGYLVAAWLIYPYRRRSFGHRARYPADPGDRELVISWVCNLVGFVLLLIPGSLMCGCEFYALSNVFLLLGIGWQGLKLMRGKSLPRPYRILRGLFGFVIVLAAAWETGWQAAISSGGRFDPGLFYVAGLAALWTGYRIAPVRKARVYSAAPTF